MASTARISPAAQERLKQLQMALERDFGHKASAEDITSALICGTTVPQLSGMLIAYNREEAAGLGKTQNS